jgi:hypothetical protein
LNTVKLYGTIKNIHHSHSVNGVDYDKAILLCKREDDKEDIINLTFKNSCNKHKEGSKIELLGNLRSFTRNIDGRNKVDIFVSTYFDLPLDNEIIINSVEIDGRICKLNDVRKINNTKRNIHFILANNIISVDSNRKFNSYIPCIAWDDLADKISQLKVSDKVILKGQIHSREYKKRLSDDDYEIRICHELLVTDLEVCE